MSSLPDPIEQMNVIVNAKKDLCPDAFETMQQTHNWLRSELEPSPIQPTFSAQMQTRMGWSFVLARGPINQEHALRNVVCALWDVMQDAHVVSNAVCRDRRKKQRKPT